MFSIRLFHDVNIEQIKCQSIYSDYILFKKALCKIWNNDNKDSNSKINQQKHQTLGKINHEYKLDKITLIILKINI